MPVKLIARFLAALNSNSRKEQMAAGMACGVLLALLPAGNLLWVTLFIVFFLFKIHYGMQMLTLALCKLLLPLAAPALDALGWAILTLPSLEPFFTTLYNAPLAPLTRFSNTLVMGGLAAGLLLWLPLFFGFRGLIALYRRRLAPKLAASKLVQALKKLPLVQSVAKALSALDRMRQAAE